MLPKTPQVDCSQFIIVQKIRDKDHLDFQSSKYGAKISNIVCGDKERVDKTTYYELKLRDGLDSPPRPAFMIPEP